MTDNTEIALLEDRTGTCFICAGFTFIRLDEDGMYELYNKVTDYLIGKGKIISKSEIEKHDEQ